MLASLLRPKNGRRRTEREHHSPFSSQYAGSSPIAERNQQQNIRHATADWTETELEDNENSDGEDGGDAEEEDEEEEDDEDEEDINSADDEDGDDNSPLLPIFSAAHLGMLEFSYATRNIC